jgi:hypothetical protein
MEHARQNQLHRTALCADDQIDARQIAVKRLGKLIPDQEQKSDGAQPQAEQ